MTGLKLLDMIVLRDMHFPTNNITLFLFVVKKRFIVYVSLLKSIPLCMWARRRGLRYKWLSSILQRKSPRLEDKAPLVPKITQRSGHRIPPISGHPGKIGSYLPPPLPSTPCQKMPWKPWFLLSSLMLLSQCRGWGWAATLLYLSQ